MVLVIALLACAPNVSIQSTRNTAIRGTIEPVAMIIYEKNTGSLYTEPLKEYLTQQLRQRRIPSRVTIITGAEFDEIAVLKRTAKDARGVVFILPVGATSYDGSLKQILYEVSAFLITNQETGEIRKVWHARIDTNSGGFEGQIKERLELFAQELVTRLVRDKVLPAHYSPKPRVGRPKSREATAPARKPPSSAKVADEESDDADDTDDAEADGEAEAESEPEAD